jgi:hypothetical protein
MTGTSQTLLYACAAMAHPSVRAVSMSVDVESKLIAYELEIDSKTFKLMDKIVRLAAKGSIIGLWRLRRIVRKHGNLDIRSLVYNEAMKILGNDWRVKVDIRDEAEQSVRIADRDIGEGSLSN